MLGRRPKVGQWRTTASWASLTLDVNSDLASAYSEGSSFGKVTHHSRPSASQFCTSSATKNCLAGFCSKRPPSVYALISKGIAS
jgi:hypothetical protein